MLINGIRMINAGQPESIPPLVLWQGDKAKPYKLFRLEELRGTVPRDGHDPKTPHRIGFHALMLDFQTRRFSKHQLIYIAPNQIHHFIKDPRAHKACLLAFRPEILPAELLQIDEKRVPWSIMCYRWPSVTKLKPTEAGLLEQQLDFLERLDLDVPDSSGAAAERPPLDILVPNLIKLMWAGYNGAMSSFSGFLRDRFCALANVNILAVIALAWVLLVTTAVADESVVSSEWKRNAFATSVFEINGAEGRNNPLRRQLKQLGADDELFVRYRVRYDADSVDTPAEDEGEFVVLWLDEAEGNDGSTHTGGIPNVGIHVSAQQNRFMVRYAPQNEKFASPLVGGRDFLVVARLWKSRSGADQPFDQLNLWVDPKPTAEFKPHASTASSKAISQVNWIGFSTGGKTEVEDRIFVWDIELATTWQEILNLPQQPTNNPATIPIAKRTIDFDKTRVPDFEHKVLFLSCGT